VPKREIAWQILALNTEKAHNLREKSLEVIRITRGLLGNAEDARRAEREFATTWRKPRSSRSASAMSRTASSPAAPTTRSCAG